MAGIGVGGSIPLLFTYTSEIVPQHNKGYFMSILSLNWMVSAMFQMKIQISTAVRKLNSNKILFQLANVGTAGLAYLILPMSMSISSWRIFMGRFYIFIDIGYQVKKINVKKFFSSVHLTCSNLFNFIPRCARVSCLARLKNARVRCYSHFKTFLPESLFQAA